MKNQNTHSHRAPLSRATILFMMSLLSTLLFSTVSYARTITVSGSGHQMGTCDYTSGYFCIYNLKSSAEREGQMNMEYNCRAQGGRPLGYSAYCSSSCFPSIIPPGQPSLVSCTADCTMQCELN